MSEAAAGPSPTLDAQHLEAVCERFETAWKTGELPPRLEDFLFGAAAERGPLLEELIALDVHYRRLRGDQPQPAEYQARFPDLEAAHLNDAFLYPLPAAGPPKPVEVLEHLRRFPQRNELSRGRRHIVFLSEDARGGRQVLKVLRGDAALRRQCLEKARGISALTHPCLLPPTEFGEVADLCFVVSTFVEGTLLSDWLRLNPRPEPKLMAALAAELADAVHQLHQGGLGHGRINSTNVLLVARDPTTPVPFVPKLLGGLDTALDGPADDVLHLGALLYEMLVGQAPTSETPPLAEMRRDLPRRLTFICLKSLRLREQGGYGSARAFADDLTRFLGGGSRRSLWWLLGAGAAAAVVLALLLRRLL